MSNLLLENTFNTVDIIIIAVFFQLLLFFVLLLLRRQKGIQYYLLAAFILLEALSSPQYLVFYKNEFRVWILANYSYYSYFIYALVFFLEGPVLYLYLKSITYKRISLTVSISLPILFYAVFFVYSVIDINKIINIYEYELTPNLIVLWKGGQMVMLGGLLSILYGLFCLMHIYKHIALLKERFANFEQLEFFWLKTFCMLFFVSWIARLVIFGLNSCALQGNCGFFTEGTIPFIAFLHNIYLFCIVTTLFISSLIYAKPLTKNSESDENGTTLIPEGEMEKLTKYMENEKPYKYKYINRERLAQRLEISPKLLSAIIHSHFNQNFFEFINSYRTKEAINMLSDPSYKGKTIEDIYTEVGFNSKSSFNSYFKKVTGVTPSEFRNSGASSTDPYNQSRVDGTFEST